MSEGVTSVAQIMINPCIGFGSMSVDQIFPNHFNNYLRLVHLSTALLLLPDFCEGIWSRVTMTSMTSAWYNKISSFETIMVGLVILQVFVLRYLRILPVDLTALIADGHLKYGRKKRQTKIINNVEGRLSELLFTALRRIDEQDCLLRSICELQSKSIPYKLPKRMDMTFAVLRRSSQTRKRRHEIANNQTIEERTVLSVFEEAVDVGNNLLAANNSDDANCPKTKITICANHYHLCPLSTEDIIHYVESIGLNDF